MALSLRRMNFLPPSVQSMPKCSLGCATMHKLFLNPSHGVRAVSRITTTSAAKFYRCRTMICNWVGINLCALLILLNWAGGVEGIAYSRDAAIVALQSIGFVWKFDVPNIQIVFYSPQQLSRLHFNPNTNSKLARSRLKQENMPEYAVDCLDKSICFKLRDYPNADIAMYVLNELRRIAVIKVNTVIIKNISISPRCQQTTLLILCRLANMFECKELQFHFDDLSPIYKCMAPPDRTRCREEAQNTLKHAGNVAISLKLLSLLPPGVALENLLVNLAVMRHVVNITFSANLVPKIATYLSHFALVDDFSLILVYQRDDIVIDLVMLRQVSHKCANLIFDIRYCLCPTIKGLEKGLGTSQTTTLIGEWSGIQYLVKNNPTAIRVHIISNPHNNTHWDHHMHDAHKIQTRPASRVYALKVDYRIFPNHVCRSLSYYDQLFTPDSFAKYGISVRVVHASYVGVRCDLHTGLHELCEIGALDRMPADIKNRKVVCLGDALNNPNWTLQEPVIIRLFCYFPRDTSKFFCQHIRYTAIMITGDGTPYLGQVKDCNGLLDRLMNIKAQKLYISYIHDDMPTTTTFDPDRLQAELDKYPKYRLTLQTLFLDDVDERIIYRMLGRYDFTGPTEIHLLNQRFTNLAVTKILALPVFATVSKLVINTLLGLNEVKYFHQQKTLKDFSLFNYIDDHKGQKSVEELGLSKLFLLPGRIAFGSLREALHAFMALGIQVLPTLVKNYSLGIDYTYHPHVARMKELAYCEIALETLKADLTNYQARFSSPTNLPPSPASIQYEWATELLLYINGNQFLTAADLVTIIHWIAGQFKNITTLWLANVKWTKEERTAIASHEYMIRDLPYLQSIQIEDTTPNADPICLALQPYWANLITIGPSPEPTFTAVSYKILSLLYTYCNNIQKLIPNYDNSNASLQMIIKDLKLMKACESIPKCRRCNKALYRPQVNMAKNELSIKKHIPNSSPEENITVLCYFCCGHPFCIDCTLAAQTFKSLSFKTLATKITNETVLTCPYCHQLCVLERFNQLISISSSTFVVPDSSNDGFAIDPKWLINTTGESGQYYFYTTYQDMADLMNNLKN
ncbi:hypothetical protein NEHOM01_1699 [Nematocida homosporus]|uniref:uncharacterized protein n=1 Tax=Nematocida homosporus TaxID=1912981 RepID=UPI0022207505|nr:uncharacterized protein NEHOM01_1699 [Nematocida homosporus]KAI5186779.1 hypothetical protein NEHOM01_1699 [Nematocida homosporus]